MADLEQSLKKFSSASAQDLKINLTEIISRNDHRSSSPGMLAAMPAEIKSLLERGAFKIILKEDVPSDGNVLLGRFVLAVKYTEDGRIKFRARYVIGGH